jgi:hypothetical protein
MADSVGDFHILDPASDFGRQLLYAACIRLSMLLDGERTNAKEGFRFERRVAL